MVLFLDLLFLGLAAQDPRWDPSQHPCRATARTRFLFFLLARPKKRNKKKAHLRDREKTLAYLARIRGVFSFLVTSFLFGLVLSLKKRPFIWPVITARFRFSLFCFVLFFLFWGGRGFLTLYFEWAVALSLGHYF